MPGQYQSLGEVKTQAIYRADLEGISDRHPSFMLGVEANASYRRLRLKLANADVMHVLTATAAAPLPTTPALANCGYAEIDWPIAAISVHGLDVLVDGDWEPIPQGNMTNRRAHGRTRDTYDRSYRGRSDLTWIPRTLPTASAATPQPGKIMIFPVPSTTVQYVLWYLEQWTDIVLDTDVFPAQEGWIDWVIWDLAATALIRDTGPATTAQLEHVIASRERVWNDIRGSALRLHNDGPIEVVSRYGRGNSTHRLVP